MKTPATLSCNSTTPHRLAPIVCSYSPWRSYRPSPSVMLSPYHHEPFRTPSTSPSSLESLLISDRMKRPSTASPLLEFWPYIPTFPSSTRIFTSLRQSVKTSWVHDLTNAAGQRRHNLSRIEAGKGRRSEVTLRLRPHRVIRGSGGFSGCRVVWGLLAHGSIGLHMKTSFMTIACTVPSHSFSGSGITVLLEVRVGRGCGCGFLTSGGGGDSTRMN